MLIIFSFTLGREAVVVLPGSVQTFTMSESGDVCQGQTGNEGELERPGEFALKCNKCGTSFRQKDDLDQHQRTHIKEKAFKCNYCFKCFSHKGHLNEHTRIHTGEKPFSCNQCDKRFNRKGLLKQHLKTHTEENRLTYDKTEQLFSDQGSFQTPTTTYTGEGTLNGNQFNRSFSQSSSLQQHTTVDGVDTTSHCDQGDKFEMEEDMRHRETERANQTAEPCEYGF